jgi:hypothetical protein
LIGVSSFFRIAFDPGESVYAFSWVRSRRVRAAPARKLKATMMPSITATPAVE